MASWPVSWWEATGEHVKDGPIYRTVYRNIHTNEETHKLPVAAIFRLPSLAYQTGADGESWVCVIPYNKEGYADKTHYWYIDEVASNCNMEKVEHNCWTRTGEWGVSVDVQAGPPGHSGAGSIAVSGFHGFLHSSELKDC